MRADKRDVLAWRIASCLDVGGLGDEEEEEEESEAKMVKDWSFRGIMGKIEMRVRLRLVES